VPGLFDCHTHVIELADEGEIGMQAGLAEFVRRAIPPDHRERVKRYRDVRTPTMVLVGLHDKMVGRAGAERLAKEMPNATLCVLDACGHAPQEDAPERVNARLLEFFRS